MINNFYKRENQLQFFHKIYLKGLYITAVGRFVSSFPEDYYGPEIGLYKRWLIYRIAFLTAGKYSQRTFRGEDEYHSEYQYLLLSRRAAETNGFVTTSLFRHKTESLPADCRPELSYLCSMNLEYKRFYKTNHFLGNSTTDIIAYKFFHSLYEELCKIETKHVNTRIHRNI